MTSKKWKEFSIENVFDTLRASFSGIDKNKLVKDGNDKIIPYLTRSDMDNGISMFINVNQNNKYKIDNGNVISIGLDTQTVFYQPHSFYTGQNIQVLSNLNMNSNTALFLVRLLKRQLQKFCWGGNGATLGRLKKTKILLPVNDNDEPDYEYMEQYIKSISFNKYKDYLDYAIKFI